MYKLQTIFFNQLFRVRALFWLMSLFLVKANAQTVSYYAFSQSSETYTELTNPTEIATPLAQSGTGAVDDNVYTLPEGTIPFGFPFNGTSYTGLNVYANGFITFGSITLNNSQPISSSVAYEGVIAPLSGDLVALYEQSGLTGGITYQVVGDAPNREFVVQWKHFTTYSSSGYTINRYDFNFQARLHENGQITFVYDASVVGNPSSISAKVGLRGASNAHYVTRSATGTASSNWNSTTSGSSNSAGISTNGSYLPTSGLTFVFIPPTECTTPTAQPSNLVLTNTGIIINGSFTAADPEADRYLVLRNISGTTPNTPSDGMIYSIGQNESLNSYVAYYGASTSFENNYTNAGITGNNTYEYTIYSVNSSCTGGPLYYTTNPLSGTITNCPITPNGMTAGTPTINSFVLNWPYGENGDALPMNRVIEIATDSNFTNMIVGSPFILAKDDVTLTVTGLEANTQYYYRSKNITSLCESAYSATGSIYTSCMSVSDFSENFDNAPYVNFSLQLPNCWSKITVGAGSYTPTVNVTATYHNSAPNGVTFYGNGADMSNLDNKAILVSPMLTNVGEGTHRLRFQAKMSSSGGTYELQVVALSSNTADAIIEVIETITASQLSTNYQEFSANFNNYSGTANYVGLRRINGSSYSYLCVDDIVWEEIPSCPELQSVMASNPTVDGATISWTDTLGVPQNGYEYFVSTINTLPSESEIFETTTENSVVITGQSNGTHYVFVRRVCSEDEKSPWRQASFSTVPTTPAPWLEEFGNSTPTGWTTTGWSLGTSAGYPGNSGMNLYKNLYGSFSTGTFTTIAVGPLNADNYELSFDYRQGSYNSPYAPLETWGNFVVEVSDDFGATWNQIGVVTDNEDNNQNNGTQLQYVKKTYSLEDYQGKYVKIRVSATRTAGDLYLSFDNFSIDQSEEETGYCTPEFFYPSSQAGVKLDKISLVGETTTWEVDPIIYNENGYADYTNSISVNLIAGNSYDLNFHTDWQNPEYINVRAWIDYNLDYQFDDEEEIGYIVNGIASSGEGTFNFNIPENISNGDYRLRLVAQFPNSTPENLTPCGTINSYGIAIDYVVNIQENLGIDYSDKKNISIYPNPTNGIVNISPESDVKEVSVFNITGQLVLRSEATIIDLSRFKSGVYLLKVQMNDNSVMIHKIIKK